MAVIFLMGLLVAGGKARAVLIWLDDGTILQGKILEHNKSEVVLQRYDNGGIVDIPWRYLHPLCRELLQNRLGIVVPKKPAYKVPGVKIYLKTGGVVAGKMIRKDSSFLIVKNRTGRLPIPFGNILTSEKSLVALTDIYDSQELYQEYQQRYDLKTADGNFKFAKFLLRLDDYAHSKHHLQQALKLQPDLEPQIRPLIEEIIRASESERHKKLLQLYHIYKNSHRYGRARQALLQLQPLLGAIQWQEYQRQLTQEQDRYLKQEITGYWMQKVHKKIRQLVFKRDSNLASARQYLLEEINNAIVEELAQELGLSTGQIKEYFRKRENKRRYRYSYRHGTFIVSSQGHAIGASSKDPEKQWWQTANSSARQEWLHAYYCENHLEVVERKQYPCPQCAGRGTITSGGRSHSCPLCHGVKYEKTVIAR